MNESRLFHARRLRGQERDGRPKSETWDRRFHDHGSRVAASLLRDCIECTRLALEDLGASEVSPEVEARLCTSERIARILVQRGERVPHWVGALAVCELFVSVVDAGRGTA